MLTETQRQQFLQAMGVDVYVLRTRAELPVTEIIGRAADTEAGKKPIVTRTAQRRLVIVCERAHGNSRGATVEYLECYRRVKPDRDMRELLSRMGRDGMKACLATSSTILENLFEMAGAAGRSWLCSTPFFVPHPRVAATAFSRGVQCVFVAGNGDEALVAGLETWFARLRANQAAS